MCGGGEENIESDQMKRVAGLEAYKIS